MAITKAELLDALAIFKELQDADNATKFVAKDGAKVLSTNDFTDAFKTKLEGIADENVERTDIASLFGGASSGQ